jgi:murein DD-endopeptidase / murein LD-carboxypeptidase
MKNQWLILLLFLSLACGFAAAQDSNTVHSDTNWYKNQERNYYSQNFGFEVPSAWNKTLFDTLENWLGTPYCYAGNSTSGTDCSGFVNALYLSVFNTNIGARNSTDIYKKITKVDQSELEEGDLVFFRIRKKRISHVGIYLGNHKFAHASTSNGVIISDLNDRYYKKYYAGGGRLPSISDNINNP